MKSKRPDRNFVPGEVRHDLEKRLPLDGDGFEPSDAWGGPIEIQIPPLPPVDPSLLPPPEPPPPVQQVDPNPPMVADAGPVDPFENPFADPVTPTPDAPAPPDSAGPAFAPDE